MPRHIPKKRIRVEGKPLDQLMQESIDFLAANAFEIKPDKMIDNVLHCKRGNGIVLAQQYFTLEFRQQDSAVIIDGEFAILSSYYFKSPVAEDAIMASVPRRKGYRLMMDYVDAIGGQFIEI